ncbi:LytR/AlgR family response regulator transcription factor [Cellulosilyticum sp. I15G10I2]|uniref:LytR/AlgR family response regulator transcription factor n=1 Tax=Cellulosilyticum sp. I15G10I2 TaxID=1892843 RepID=UPI00085BD202|nr:LytTR family DNA-binding domain-containing protein [Cellulosilyticum sp. I15G10I2]
MLRIAICDDEKAICAQLEYILEEISSSCLEEVEIEVFFSGEELYSYLMKNTYFDMIFLDIELKFMNGIDVGKKIREEMLNETTQIIYISAKDSYAMELFEVRPLNFLIKPLKAEKIKDVFTTALRLIKKNEQFFTYQVGQTSYKISIKDILYFESNDRKVNIITTRGVDTFYGSLVEIFKELEKYKFLNIHKSYLVNYTHIIRFEYSQVTLSNNKVLPISQSRRKTMRSLQFQLERNG